MNAKIHSEAERVSRDRVTSIDYPVTDEKKKKCRSSIDERLSIKLKLECESKKDSLSGYR